MNMNGVWKMSILLSVPFDDVAANGMLPFSLVMPSSSCIYLAVEKVKKRKTGGVNRRKTCISCLMLFLLCLYTHLYIQNSHYASLCLFLLLYIFCMSLAEMSSRKGKVAGGMAWYFLCLLPSSILIFLLPLSPVLCLNMPHAFSYSAAFACPSAAHLPSTLVTIMAAIWRASCWHRRHAEQLNSACLAEWRRGGGIFRHGWRGESGGDKQARASAAAKRARRRTKWRRMSGGRNSCAASGYLPAQRKTASCSRIIWRGGGGVIAVFYKRRQHGVLGQQVIKRA
jgi:hypothetical protein